MYIKVFLILVLLLTLFKKLNTCNRYYKLYCIKVVNYNCNIIHILIWGAMIYQILKKTYFCVTINILFYKTILHICKNIIYKNYNSKTIKR